MYKLIQCCTLFPHETVIWKKGILSLFRVLYFPSFSKINFLKFWFNLFLLLHNQLYQGLWNGFWSVAGRGGVGLKWMCYCGTTRGVWKNFKLQPSEMARNASKTVNTDVVVHVSVHKCFFVCYESRIEWSRMTVIILRFKYLCVNYGKK